MTRRQQLAQSRQEGYFGIGVWHPKTESNVGTLLRSAKTYGAAFIATVGPQRYHPQASDTCKTPLSVPLLAYADIDDLIDHLPDGCPLVGVELSERAQPLPEFVHPTRAMYLLGAEDHGIPDAVLDGCHYVVQIPSPEPWSLNVAVAGSAVIMDRYFKERQRSESMRMPVGQ